MTIESDLLRMLEPVMRPDGLPGRSSAPTEPFESRSFDSILDEARRFDLGGGEALTQTQTPSADQPRQVDMLSQLGQVDRIANPTLLQLIDRNAMPSTASPSEI